MHLLLLLLLFSFGVHSENPYFVQTRKSLNLPVTQRALIIWDEFKGQMTDKVKSLLSTLSIELVPVPANMTHFFQPLDLTVNWCSLTLLYLDLI